MEHSTQEEYIKQAMTNVMQAKQRFKLKGQLKNACIIVDQATLSHCLVTLAHLIHEGGDVYLPIFERIRLELEQQKNDMEMKNLAMDLVVQSTQNSPVHLESLY